ncbi:helix-turn-helix domain-containing protein [Membranihabitans maritimus]|uniref:helix-turn-helix domain-containing protein n=1 Tax=Membranihabitans maritimus TaxID=2904244 RepID=UPI001F40461C|nr:response regulator transcription factor [Membranihabitans maritimus]
MEKKNRSVSEFNNELKLRGFNVFQIEKDGNSTKTYSRKDFYKICLTTGQSKIHYADQSFDHHGTILFFGNPHIPYSWETISRTYIGYTCLFSEEFLKISNHTDSILQSPLFKLGGTPVLRISDGQRDFLNGIFAKMIEEQDTEYQFKDEIIRNYIHLIIHEAMKMEPSENIQHKQDASSRLTSVFLELLERQFPIETPDTPLKLRTARDYAHQLAVHVNYLNRAVKSVTGKSTSNHISERIASEAKALLQHTDWNISEIAFALGFQYPTYFNNYFKKATGRTPKALRVKNV